MSAKKKTNKLLSDAFFTTEKDLRYISEGGATQISKLRAMDVASFTYRSKFGVRDHSVLCVMNERTGAYGDPFFVNTNTSNYLLSCFSLDGTSPESLGVIFNSLYRNEVNVLRKIASYRYFKNLFSLLLGKKQYKTFNRMNISGMTRYVLTEIE
jgi:hypothetical protein